MIGSEQVENMQLSKQFAYDVMDEFQGIIRNELVSFEDSTSQDKI